MAEVEKKPVVPLVVAGACGGCLLIVIILALVLAGMAAKTGLVFGGKNFEAPEPTRVVEPLEQTRDQIQTTVVKSLTASLGSGDATLVLTESMLTTLLQTTLKEDPETAEAFVTDEAQVAVLDSGELEFYLPVTADGKESAMTMLIVPRLSGDDLSLDIVNAKVGNLNLPDFVTSIPEQTANKVIASQLDEINKAVDLSAIELKAGELILRGEILLPELPF